MCLPSPPPFPKVTFRSPPPLSLSLFLCRNQPLDSSRWYLLLLAALTSIFDYRKVYSVETTTLWFARKTQRDAEGERESSPITFRRTWCTLSFKIVDKIKPRDKQAEKFKNPCSSSGCKSLS